MEISPSIEASALPDWSAITEEILCPLCGYNLRGLPEPRCPECGFRFVWAELLDAARRQHPFLFEHHLASPVWSFFRTAAAGLRPQKFWAGLHPAQRVRPWALLAYWLVLLQPYLVMAGLALSFGNLPPTFRAALGWRRLPEIQLQLCLLTIVWPAVVFLSLLVFQQSMRRTRLRSVHIMRCVVYSHDLLLWLSMGVFASFAALYVWEAATSVPTSPLVNYAQDFTVVMMMITPVLLIAGAARLYRAYQLYLRFDRPLATIVAAQIIAGLASLNASLIWTYGIG